MDGSNDVTKGFDINQSMVLCFNELGCGEAALRKFSAITAIPGLAHNTYRRLPKKVGVAHTQVTANVLTAAVRAVNDAYTRNGADDSNDDDVDDDTSDSDSVRGDGDDADGGQIWARCPKTVHVGASRINAAVASAVSHFNHGCSHLSQVMKKLG
ncbi:hypothetical protein ACOMHN_059120 [Nucella lapillus]